MRAPHNRRSNAKHESFLAMLYLTVNGHPSFLAHELHTPHRAMLPASTPQRRSGRVSSGMGDGIALR